MAESSENLICQRIAKVRLDVAGPRGKASFAKKLGLSPSTYSYYEDDRVPPAEVLLRIADEGGADLRWLITGEGPGGVSVPADHPILQRAARLLGDRPDAAGPLAAFLDILAASLAFPSKPAEADRSGAAVPEAPRAIGGERGESARAVAEAAEDRPASWIPVLGRSAAGVPQFWSGGREPDGVRTLRDLIDRHAGRPATRAPAASAGPGQPRDGIVQIVTLTDPPDEVSQFIAAPALKRRFPDAFAVRIDGDSMAPDIRHGDLVVLSPSAPAGDGEPAVVQLRGQIGVTCKIFRRQGDRVHLVPVNEQVPPSAYPAGELVWALRVLARVRAHGPGGV